MQYRKLGVSDLEVSAIGLGAMNFGWLCDESCSSISPHLDSLTVGVSDGGCHDPR